MAWIFASVVLVLLVLSSGFRKFFLGVALVLSITGLLLYGYEQHINQEKARELQKELFRVSPAPREGDFAETQAARQRAQRHLEIREEVPTTPPVDAIDRLAQELGWTQPLASRSTTTPPSGGQGSAIMPSALPAITPGVATPVEAAQAVQRLRAKDFRRWGKGEKSVLSAQQADVSQPTATGSPQQTTTVFSPSRHAELSSEESESLELACFFAKSQGPAAYNACRSSQIAKLANALPRPNLAEVSSAEHASLELACFLAKSQGPTLYNPRLLYFGEYPVN